MAEEFTPITTQADFDAAVAQCMKDERAAAAAQKEKLDTMTRTLAERDATIKGYETAALKSRVARELGIPEGLADRLTGENEDDIRKDAEGLRTLLKHTEPKAPPRSTEPADDKSSHKRAAFRALVNNLTNN